MLEMYFDTPFWQAPLPSDIYSYWAQVEGREYNFDVPPRNKFIPTQLSLETSISSGPLNRDDQEAFNPLLVVNEHEGGLKLWHCLDLRFNIPKVVITTRIASTRAQDSALNAALTSLLVRTARDCLQEELYMASMASLDLSISATDVSIDFCVAGYSEKASELYEVGLGMFFNACRDVENATLFSLEIIKRQYEQMLKDMRNMGLSAAASAKNGRLCALKVDRFTYDDQLNALFGLDIGDDFGKLRLLLQEYLVSYLSEIYIEGLCQGNFSLASVEQLSAMIITITNGISKMCKDHCPLQPILQVPKKQKHIILNVTPKNPNEENCAIECYYQLGPFNMESLTMLYLIEQILYEPFYDTLRTNAQIGYSVNLGVRETYGILGLCFQVTSSSHSIEDVRRAIYTFIENIPHFLASMKLFKGDKGNSQRVFDITGNEYKNKSKAQEDHIFLDQVAALVDNKLMPHSSLSDACKSNWAEIEERRYAFNRNYDQAMILLGKVCNACWDDMGSTPVGWTNDVSNEKLEILLKDLVKMSETLFVDKNTKRLMIIQSSLNNNLKEFKAVKVSKKQMEAAKKVKDFDLKKAVTIIRPKQAREYCEEYESAV